MELITKHILEMKRRIDAQHYVEASEYILQTIDRYKFSDSNISDFIHEFVTKSIEVRDQGNHQSSLEMMIYVWERHKNFNLCLEILVVLVSLKKDCQRFLDFSKTIPSGFAKNPHISLFLAGGSFLAGDLRRSTDFLQNVTLETVRNIPSFAIFRQQLLFKLSGAVSELLLQISTATNDSCTHDMSHMLQVNRFAIYLKGIEDFSAFEFALISGILYPAADVKIPINLIGDIAAEFSRQAPDDERNVILFRLLVAFKIIEKANYLGELWVDSKFSDNPDFVKQLFKLSEFDGMEKWRPIAVRLASELVGLDNTEGHWRHQNSDVQFKELSARILFLKSAPDSDFQRLNLLPKARAAFNVNSTDQEHVFIGMFGQCRFSNHVFPLLMDKLASETEAHENRGMKFSYGIATWDKGGSRGLFDPDSIHFLLPHLPIEIHDAVLQLGCQSVGEVRRYLPNLINFCASLAAAESDITTDYLKSKLSTDFKIDIWNDSQFKSLIGQRVSDRFSGNFHLVNQARMWNRIAALRELAKNAESEKTVPITRYLILRSDLVFSGTSLLSNLFNLTNGSRDNFLIGDHDPHANFIEGLGDRIMLCDRQAFARITSGQELFLNVIDAPDSMKPYMSRCHAHQFLETILFEQDTRLIRVPWDETRHEIYRGRLTMQQILPHLVLDLNSDSKSLDHLRAFV
ncbi:hypothetical protein GOZ97_00025 [Agrobacterium vitis]|uniref:hypothetical protein n=1 Tax=Rhizobium/Agrobacterium group TaxID=227290 RepID=UPI0008DC1A00|nr:MULTISPECIES: hypothetical protein [Rhizobium/Agrobacterium group]MCF1436973.1 hypothetical protein [Allorhizobium ampelinum]MCF1474591.1 hypothetical protein [Allorhizobium ampelinum]MUO92559.1 hypothetical protein [Agrobacterium vitis]MUZ51988.1 hypothetical protein [Agrobacterium vitis]MUZ89795.1 hypothetical protein [Agrobacterium vitis]